jgi:hypothetical protein
MSLDFAGELPLGASRTNDVVEPQEGAPQGGHG